MTPLVGIVVGVKNIENGYAVMVSLPNRQHNANAQLFSATMDATWLDSGSGHRHKA
jgi:hypothetical protein